MSDQRSDRDRYMAAPCAHLTGCVCADCLLARLAAYRREAADEAARPLVEALRQIRDSVGRHRWEHSVAERAIAAYETGRAARAGPEERCLACDGCGKVADTASAEPWSEWVSLPLRSGIAVLLGAVRPVQCAACGGTGRRARGTA